MKGEYDHRAYLLLGGNVGETPKLLDRAVLKLAEIGEVYQLSRMYATEPWGMEASQWFINQAVELATNLTALSLLEALLSVEQDLGRNRLETTDPGEYESRTIDIDILYFDDEVIDEDSLSIPHPRLHLRKFALVPLCEIAPDLNHPILKQTQLSLLESCKDKSILNVYE